MNRILRGGDWAYRAYSLQSARRSITYPNYTLSICGFRLVREEFFTSKPVLNNNTSKEDAMSIYKEFAQIPNDPAQGMKFAVTQGFYEEVMGKNPSHTKGETHPVEKVSYDDVTAFLKVLNADPEKYGLEAGFVYKRPTKEQYDKMEGKAEWTEEEVKKRCVYGQDKIQPVGTKEPVNGFYDLRGNCYEWEE